MRFEATTLHLLLSICCIAILLLPARHSSAQDRLRVAAESLLSQPLAINIDECDLLDIDTLLYVENRGLHRILFTVNGHRFKLATDDVEVARSNNAFLIPQFGEITMHIGRLILPGNENCVAISVRGTAGTDADIIIGDLMLPGQQVAYAVKDLVPLPELFELGAAYPNPFADEVFFRFAVPERLSDGAEITLTVYDALGRRIITLYDERYFPGTFTARWDGRGVNGAPAVSGAYFYRLNALEFGATGKVVKTR